MSLGSSSFPLSFSSFVDASSLTKHSLKEQTPPFRCTTNVAMRNGGISVIPRKLYAYLSGIASACQLKLSRLLNFNRPTLTEHKRITSTNLPLQ